MTHTFSDQIADAFPVLDAHTPVPALHGLDRLPSIFDIAGLATASIGTAAAEAAALLGTTDVRIDQRLCQLWFQRSIQPIDWQMPNPWDPLAGDYQTADGWIKLHTNAPHHRAAALAVLSCKPDRETVQETVAAWNGQALESAIIAQDGCAAILRSAGQWEDHPQGIAVAREPLIAWNSLGTASNAPSLKGLRVLDLTRVLAGPVATRFLAQMGATVLRIDPPSWEEPGVVPDVTLGKSCTGLDLKDHNDRATFETLLNGADVVVHGYRQGALDALGYDAAARQRLSGGHIDVSLNAYGHSGPWADRRGFDSLVQMSCGIAHAGQVAALADRPVPLPVQALDHATGYLMAAAVLRALRIAQADGRWMQARLSLARTAVLLMSGPAGDLGARMQPANGSDCADWVEETPWGKSHRIIPPFAFDGEAPAWSRPAGPLRRHPPSWPK